MQELELENNTKENAIIIGLHIKGTKREPYLDSLKELKFLAESSDATVHKEYLVSRDAIHATQVIGKGKAKEIKDYALENGIKLIIFDEQLSPIQERNLRKFFEIKILDRIEIILDIFSKRAQTYEAKLQIELAQLKYLLPRLTRMWVHLSRQVGGVGVRGPGETQIEIDRRRIREKIHLLKKRIEEVRKNRQIQRKARTKKYFKRFALVGYTNAGKTTILNALTDAKSVAENKLFCTLDPISKKVDLPNKETIILTDTVGFINKLPHFLVEAFNATLEEVVEADFLLHIIDGKDPNIDLKYSTIEKVLYDELKIQDKPVINIINKKDLLDEDAISDLKFKFPHAYFVSAKQKSITEDFLNTIISILKQYKKTYSFFFPMNKLNQKKILYSITGTFIEEEKYTEHGVHIKASVNDQIKGLLKEYILIE